MPQARHSGCLLCTTPAQHPCNTHHTPHHAGNLINYGGSVDVALWTTNVPAPGAQYATGTRPDGAPAYTLYDPTGESTRGLPQPRYGELKNFGYVPKPGQVGWCTCRVRGRLCGCVAVGSTAARCFTA